MAHLIEISWVPSATPGVTYNIYRGLTLNNESNVALNVSPVTGTTYTDSTVFAGIAYSYLVKAVEGAVESLAGSQVESAPVPFTSGPTLLDLGASNAFSVLAATTITVAGAGPTLIGGDLGLSPGTSITGFPPAMIAGAFHITDSVAASAIADALTTYTAYKALASGTTIGGDLSSQVLAPGVYNVATSTGIGADGTLILDGGGNPAAVWIFQVGTTLITAANTHMILINGAQAANVFWLVGTSATLGAGSTFVGTIIAHASISIGDSGSTNGRLIALTGAITFAGVYSTQMFERSSCPVAYPERRSALLPPAPPAAPGAVTVIAES